MRTVVAVILLGSIAFNAVMMPAVIRLEKYHDAARLGLCREIDGPVQRERCLATQDTRTSNWWHLYYGILP